MCQKLTFFPFSLCSRIAYRHNIAIYNKNVEVSERAKWFKNFLPFFLHPTIAITSTHGSNLPHHPTQCAGPPTNNFPTIVCCALTLSSYHRITLPGEWEKEREASRYSQISWFRILMDALRMETGLGARAN